MWPDRVSNPGPPTYESGALPIALRGPANFGLSECNRVKVNLSSTIIPKETISVTLCLFPWRKKPFKKGLNS